MKDEYLSKLRSKISILDEKEVSKIIKEYETLFNKKSKEGINEDKVIEELGEVDKLAKKILKDHKISDDYIEKGNNGFEDFINRFVNFIVNGTRDLISKIEKKDFSKIMEIIVYVLLIMFALWLLRLPFFILEAIGHGMFGLFFYPVGSGLSILWSFFVNVCYIILVIWIIVIIFGKFNHKEVEIKRTKTSKKKEEVKIINGYKDAMEDNESEASIKRVGNVFIDILMAFFKALIVIMVLPLIIMEVGLFIAIGAIALLIFSGVFLIGPLLIVIGLMLIFGAIIKMIFYLSFDKGDGRR